MSCPTKLPASALPRPGDRIERRSVDYIVVDVAEHGDRVVITLANAWQLARLAERAVAMAVRSRDRAATAQVDCLVEVYP